MEFVTLLLYRKEVLREIRAFWLVSAWSGFLHMDCFNGHKLHIVLFSEAGKIKSSMAQVPYNKLLANLACSSRTGKYLPFVVLCRVLAALGPFNDDLMQIFPSTALALG